MSKRPSLFSLTRACILVLGLGVAESSMAQAEWNTTIRGVITEVSNGTITIDLSQSDVLPVPQSLVTIHRGPDPEDILNERWRVTMIRRDSVLAEPARGERFNTPSTNLLVTITPIITMTKEGYDKRIEIRRLYEKQAHDGNSHASHYVGLAYNEFGDYQNALIWLHKAVDNGVIKAFADLGYVYEVLGDYESAERNYLKGSEHQHYLAEARLLRLYRDIYKDRTRADAWLREAAAAGSEYANTVLAGQGVAEPQAEDEPAQPRVAQDTEPPRITFNRGISVSARSRHSITGRAIDSSGVAIVEVNGKEAQLDGDGNFSASVLLKPGTNSFTIVAYDVHDNRASKTISIERETAQVAAETLTTGKYIALIIGVEEYQDDLIADLDEPLNDARRIRSILEQRYTFEARDILFLENPTRGDIMDTFDDLGRTITRKDNLFIFYAGHGYWDEKIGQGYWLPSDTRSDSRSAWIANSTIQNMIRGINSKHTLLVSDACFSGGLFKIRSAFSDAPREAKALYALPSRKAMTSGTLTEVPDVSVFVRYLIQRLQENDQTYLPSQQLFMSFRTAVINNSPLQQIPQYGEIRETGDEGGDFIFIRRSP